MQRHDVASTLRRRCINVMCPLGSIISSYLLTGAERFSRDMELMLGYRAPVFLRVCWCFVSPTAFFVSILFLRGLNTLDKSSAFLRERRLADLMFAFLHTNNKGSTQEKRICLRAHDV